MVSKSQFRAGRIVLHDQSDFRGRNRGRAPMPTVNTLKVSIASAFAVLGAGFHTLPMGVQSACIAAFLLTLSDTLTGIWVAGRLRDLQSVKMRQKLASKAGQFLIILTFGSAGKLLADSWVPVGVAVGLIIGIEFASNLENLTRLEKLGGAPLGPLRSGLQRLGAYFPAPGDDARDIPKAP